MAQKGEEQSLQYSVAWFSSQPSHTTLLGSACTKEEAAEAAASTVEAKWLMGREEAAVVVPCPFCFSSSFLVVILKTARHIGHLKGALPNYVQLIFNDLKFDHNQRTNELTRTNTVCNPFVKTSETSRVETKARS